MNTISNDPAAQTRAAIHDAIASTIAGASIDVGGGRGHFTIKVVSAEFAGKSTLQRQRMVHRAVADLMNGADAPLHAIDKLETLTP